MSTPHTPLASRPTSKADSSQLTALIVDADWDAAEDLAGGLRRKGWRVRVAASAEEALELVRTMKPRAVVVDLVLPFMSGFVLVRQLKADPVTRDVCIVATADVLDPETKELLRAVGCTACVQNPVYPDALSDVLRGDMHGLTAELP